MITTTRRGYKFDIPCLFHITHYLNLESIMINGILSHKDAYNRNLIQRDISSNQVQYKRSKKPVFVQNKWQTLHDLVPLYFEPNNPMYFQLCTNAQIKQELLILLVDSLLLTKDNTVFTDGNAASRKTKFFNGVEKLNKIQLEILQDDKPISLIQEFNDDVIRIKCAEVLVFPTVHVNEIRAIVCPNDTVLSHAINLRNSIGPEVSHINISTDESFFF
jgi:hypothetical protein